MPKFSLVVSQTTVLTVEAESAAAIEDLLDDKDELNELVTYVATTAHEVETEIKEPSDGVPVDLRLVDGSFRVAKRAS